MIRASLLLVALAACVPVERAAVDPSSVELGSSGPADLPRVEVLAPRVFENGVQVDELRVGSGPIAERGSKVALGYVGRTQDGVEFATSEAKAEPFTFVLGAQNVNPIWEQGIDGMRMGGRRRIWIPPELINGGQGRPPAIPPGVTLIFDVELLEVR